MATQTPNNSSQQATEEPPQNKPKRIRIWLNDEPDCYKLLIDPRAVKNWTYVLNYVSKETKSRFGPVKKLISLRTMAPVTSFEELDTSGKYVALGYNQKLRIDKDLYRTPSEKETAAAKPIKRHYVGEFDSKILPFLKITKKHNLTLVYMALNGVLDGPFKVVFKAVDLKNWNLIKSYVTKVLGVTDGVQNICTVFGEPLHDAKEFQHGCLYVAVPFFERFKVINPYAHIAIAMDYMYLFGEQNKSKLESSYPLEKSNLTKKTIKRKKKSPVPSDRRSENCSQEFDSDNDFYTNGEIQSSLLSGSSEDMDSTETNDMGPNPSLMEQYSDSLMEETKSTDSDGSEDGLIWPSSRIKPTSLSSKQSLPSGCICLKQKRKNELPLLNKRIQRLTRTIKTYEKKLMRLQTKSLEKEREQNNEDTGIDDEDEDIFENHRYRTFFRSY